MCSQLRCVFIITHSARDKLCGFPLVTVVDACESFLSLWMRNSMQRLVGIFLLWENEWGTGLDLALIIGETQRHRIRLGQVIQWDGNVSFPRAPFFSQMLLEVRNPYQSNKLPPKYSSTRVVII